MATFGSYSDILTRDPETLVEEHYHWDELSGQTRLEQRQHVRPILEDAKRRFNAVNERTPFRKNGEVVATLPLVIYEQLRRQGIMKDQKALARWLDDPDNRAFRIRPGKLSK